MKKTIKIATTIMMLTGMILIQSCSKEGAQGIKGDTGATGAQGPAGPAGPAGNSGSSNVHSTIYTSYTWNWYSLEKYLFVNLTCPYIDSNVMNYGLVLAYRKEADAWIAFPNTYYPIGNNDLTCTYDLNRISLGQCRIRFWRSDRQQISGGSPALKIVTVSGSAKAAHPNTNWNNYEEVEAILNN